MRCRLNWFGNASGNLHSDVSSLYCFFIYRLVRDVSPIKLPNVFFCVYICWFWTYSSHKYTWSSSSKSCVFMCSNSEIGLFFKLYMYISIKKYTTSHVSEGIHCFYFGFNDNGQQNKQMRWRRVKPQFEKRNQQLTHHIFAFWMQYRICIYVYIYFREAYICVFLQTKFSDLEFSEQLRQYIFIYEWKIVDWAIFVFEALACLEFWEWRIESHSPR